MDDAPAALYERLRRDGALARVLAAAREEDLGTAGDVTSRSILEPGRTARTALVAREAGVAAGLRLVPEVLAAFAAAAVFTPAAGDGASFDGGRTLGHLEGDAVAILGVERTLLNLVGRLSGIATLTRRYVDAVAGTDTRICATRKTTPGLRALEKYAVACGGGLPHRMGLFDAALYKDNHLAHVPPRALADRLARAIRVARDTGPLDFVEVEVDTLEQLRTILALAPGLVDFVLLDNMTAGELRDAVRMRDDAASSVQLEASGGITLDMVRACAETGVNRISVGALTHSAACLDVALDAT